MPLKEEKSTPLTYVEVTEQKRLNEAREKGIPWKKWGPYLSEDGTNAILLGVCELYFGHAAAHDSGSSGA